VSLPLPHRSQGCISISTTTVSSFTSAVGLFCFFSHDGTTTAWRTVVWCSGQRARPPQTLCHLGFLIAMLVMEYSRKVTFFKPYQSQSMIRIARRTKDTDNVSGCVCQYFYSHLYVLCKSLITCKRNKHQGNDHKLKRRFPSVS